MNRKTLLSATLAAGLSFAVTAPAHATFFWPKKPTCKVNCGSTSTSSTSGGTTTGGSTSGGSTPVPEPGMLGLMGAGLAALIVVRPKKAPKN